MSKRPWMPLYIGDYLADTASLTTLQHGAYLLLIMEYWTKGSLPTDEAKLARICRMTRKQWQSNCSAIASFFDSKWQHGRIDDELRKARQISEKRALAGQVGGMKSAGYARSAIRHKQANAQANAQQTANHSHIDKKEAAGQGESSLVRLIKEKGWAQG